MKVDWDARILAWEEGCRIDEVRNNFVIPHLDKLIEGSKFRSIIDVGCATGYITRQLANKYRTKGIEWVLLDASEQMLRFAVAAMDPQLSVQLVKADITDPKDVQSVNPADMAFMAFTTLEFRMTRRIAQNIADLVVPGGTLVVFLPDVLRDILKSGSQREQHLSEYVNGYCELEKLDKFTKQPYPFYANRIETVVADFLNIGLQLLHFAIYQCNEADGENVIFGLDFKKGV
jgi:SAM-dependent methyltransferase